MIKTNMALLRGWGPRGQRLAAKVPHGHWETLTFVAALRHDRVDAPFVIDGPINRDLFTVYVETELAPPLQEGDIVILDNLGSHTGKAARQAVRARGAHLIFLPPTAPTSTRSTSSSPSSSTSFAGPGAEHEGAWRKVGELLDLVSPTKCANYFRNSGYTSA